MTGSVPFPAVDGSDGGEVLDGDVTTFYAPPTSLQGTPHMSWLQVAFGQEVQLSTVTLVFPTTIGGSTSNSSTAEEMRSNVQV